MGVKNVQIKIKNVKNVKKRDKNKLKFNSMPDDQEVAFKPTRNMPFSLVLQKLSSF